MKQFKKLVLNSAVATEAESIQEITFNLKTNLVRNDTMEGRPYKVVPMVMMVEGVHSGSNGPLFYPKEELAKSAAVWNHKPIVVYHPKGSACDPDTLTKNKIGIIMNCVCDKQGRLKAEAWLEEARIEAVDKRVLDAVNNQKMMECSTGVFTQNEYAPGEYKGKSYDYIARNHGPDHLAVLPDIKGACSIADGGGFIRNQAKAALPKGVVENQLAKAADDLVRSAAGYSDGAEEGEDESLSYNDIMGQLYVLLQDEFPPPTAQTPGYCCPYVDNLYEDYFIYCMGGKTFSQGYSIKGGMVKLEGKPSEVQRVIRYRKTDGSFVGNSETKQDTMKKTIIDALVANAASGWKETDREFLNGLPDDRLTVIATNAGYPFKKKDAADAEADDPMEGDKKKKAAKNAEATAPVAAPAKAMSLNEHIATLPAEMQEMVRNGIEASQAEKDKHIAAIVANKANPFTKEELAAKGLKELRGLAQLAAAGPGEEVRSPNYGGRADPVGNSSKTPQVALEIPTMNFAPAAK